MPLEPPEWDDESYDEDPIQWEGWRTVAFILASCIASWLAVGIIAYALWQIFD